MTASSDLHRLYQQWLEIPVERLPPNHYALLGLDDFETDVQAIEEAAQSRSAFLHQIAAGPERKIVQQMLGNVAIARRILVSNDSRRSYDESLRGGIAADVQPKEIAKLSTTTDRHSTNTPVAKSAPRRSTGQWKYHAASAAILLLIVGSVFAIYGGSGGRRAAKVPTADNPAKQTKGSPAANETNRKPGSDKGGKSNTRKRAAPSIASQSPGNRTSPVAKRRNQGSGIGANLGSDFKEILSEIEKRPKAAPERKQGDPASPKQFRPLGGLLLGNVDKKFDVKSWPSELSVVSGIDQSLETVFDCPHGFDWLTSSSGTLKISADSKSKWYALRFKQVALSPGDALELTTSLSAKMPGDLHVGLTVDGVSIGLRSTKSGLEVFAKDRGKDAYLESISKVTTRAKQSTFAVQRDPKDRDTLRWYFQSGDQSQTGTIGTAIKEKAPAAIFVSTSKKKPKQPLTIFAIKTNVK